MINSPLREKFELFKIVESIMSNVPADKMYIYDMIEHGGDLDKEVEIKSDKYVVSMSQPKKRQKKDEMYSS